MEVFNPARILLVAKPLKFDLYKLDTGGYVGSLEHAYQDSDSCAIFIHAGTGILGACENGKARAWFVTPKLGERIFTLPHSNTGQRVVSLAVCVTVLV